MDKLFVSKQIQRCKIHIRIVEYTMFKYSLLNVVCLCSYRFVCESILFTHVRVHLLLFFISQAVTCLTLCQKMCLFRKIYERRTNQVIPKSFSHFLHSQRMSSINKRRKNMRRKIISIFSIFFNI